MLVGRGDDGAEVLAGFVDAPPHLVILAPDLHGSLVLVPAADFPDVRVGRQLVPHKLGPLADDFADEDQLEPPVGHGVHLIVEVGVVRCDADASHAGLQEFGIAAVSIRAVLRPALDVVISDRCEEREIGSEYAVDRREELSGVIGIVEVPLVEHHVGAFGLDEPEDASEPRAVPAIADERDFQVRVRGNRVGRCPCVPGLG